MDDGGEHVGVIKTFAPTIEVEAREVGFTVVVETGQDVVIEQGDRYHLNIKGARNFAGEFSETTRVRHANYSTKGVTRIWSLELEFA